MLALWNKMLRHLNQYGGINGTHTHHFGDYKLELTERAFTIDLQALFSQLGVAFLR